VLDEHALASFQGAGVKVPLVELRAAMAADVSKLLFRKHVAEFIDGGVEWCLFTRIEGGTEFAFDAACAAARFERAAEPGIEERPIDEHLPYGNDGHGQRLVECLRR
jgi:hypothetical protein